MILPFDPVLLAVGPLGVRWSGVLALLGLGLAIGLSLRDLRARPVWRTRALDALAWGLPAGVLVGRLVDVLGWSDYYLTHASDLWALRLDGLSLWGGLLGGAAVAAVRLRSKRDPWRRRRILDVVVPNVALGIAVGRLGQFVDGQGQGVASSLPWATQYANQLAATPDFGVPRQPVQVYDGLLALALWVVLRSLPARLPAGTRLAGFLIVYGLARVLQGGLRLDPAFLFGLQIEQLLALGAIIFGVWYGLEPLRHSRGRTEQQTAAPPWPPRSAEDPVAA